jgi:DNA (cytosine-5)-methyltransferase 1
VGKTVTLKVLDLFSGVGGFSHALDKIEHEGEKVFETVAFCEWDEHCRKVLSKHWPDVIQFGDVTKLSAFKLKSSGKNFLCADDTVMVTARGGKSLRVIFDEKKLEEKIDVIVGGFPCTDVSVAGKQKGFIDDNGETTRSGLWAEYKRLISEIKPKWVIIENVANLRSNGLATVLKDLGTLGYDAEWEIISARATGAPHLRERIWIIAYPNCQSVREQSGRTLGQNGEGERVPGDNGEERNTELADSNDFRFWPTFATQEEKSEWWTKATAKFRHWWQTQSDLCGIYDGPTKGLHEDFRRRRIKQLGNGIVPPIVEIIGERIAHHEFNQESLL